MKMLPVFLLSFFVAFSLGLKSEPPNPGDTTEIENIVKGAVEDFSWLEAESKDDLRTLFSRYFTGALLQDVTARTWDFTRVNTDWYTRTKVEKMTVDIDGSMARVLAYIKERDMATNAVYSARGSFLLVKSSGEWRIKAMSVKE